MNSKTIMRLLFFIAAGTICYHFAAHAESGDIGQLKAQINRTWGVTIVDGDLANRIVPLVTKPDRPVTMSDVSALNEPACLRAVMGAFSVYPAKFISSLVSRVVLADQVHVWSIRTGGFQTSGILALNCDNAVQNELFYQDTVHDELAGLLLENVTPDENSWLKFDPPGFAYGDMSTYQAALRSPGSRDGDGILHQDGFVSSLGLTGINNDIETNAEKIFGHPTEFAALIQSYPAMRGKTRLLMDVYLQQAPGLKAFFDQSGLTEAAVKQ